MSSAIHIWSDASTDQKLEIAFGAFVLSTGEPQVRKLKSKTSIDAEFEIMAIAIMAAPVGSIMFTDLSNWKDILGRWNYWQLSHFKEAVELKAIEVRYLPLKERGSQYHACHQSAVAAVRAERKLRGKAK